LPFGRGRGINNVSDVIKKDIYYNFCHLGEGGMIYINVSESIMILTFAIWEREGGLILMFQNIFCHLEEGEDWLKDQIAVTIPLILVCACIS
jgi:hypothetical protein